MAPRMLEMDQEGRLDVKVGQERAGAEVEQAEDADVFEDVLDDAVELEVILDDCDVVVEDKAVEE